MWQGCAGVQVRHCHGCPQPFEEALQSDSQKSQQWAVHLRDSILRTCYCHSHHHQLGNHWPCCYVIPVSCNYEKRKTMSRKDDGCKCSENPLGFRTPGGWAAILPTDPQPGQCCPLPLLCARLSPQDSQYWPTKVSLGISSPILWRQV